MEKWEMQWDLIITMASKHSSFIFTVFPDF